MSGTTPAASVQDAPVLVPATPLAARGPGSRTLTYSPPPPTTTESKNLVNAIKGLNCSIDAAAIIKEFEWQTKAHQKVKEIVIPLTTPVVFA